MIAQLKEKAPKYALMLHLGKTKILTNVLGEDRPTELQVGSEQIQVLREGEEERYLGKELGLDAHHAIEFSYHAASGWAPFMRNKTALCNRF